MNLTKRQKVLLGVFLAGAVALVMDRAFVRPQGGPAAASADASEFVVEHAIPPSNVPVPPAQPQEGCVTRCLERLWSDEEMDFQRLRDPFSLPESWPVEGARSVGATPDPAALFAQRHQLTAVVIDGAGSYVLIDGRLLRPGQEIDGFRLVSVADRSALFDRAGTRVTLELASQ
jgi:hypothetical protein